MAIGPPMALMNAARWQKTVKWPIEGNQSGRHLKTDATNMQAVPATTEYLKLLERRYAEGRKKRGKSITPQSVNCEIVPSVHPYTCKFTIRSPEKPYVLTCSAEEAIGPKVFHIAQDHMVNRENRSRMYHLCQYRL